MPIRLHALTDAVIWGRRTYEGMASYWLTVPGNPDSTPAELEHARFLDGATKIVVSRTLDQIDWNDATNTVLIKRQHCRGNQQNQSSSPARTSGFSAARGSRKSSCSLT